jgi:pimeloyl-ACP methyl ester carboxylesterase
MDRLGLGRVDMMGCSVGGWIANEMATKVPERIRKLALVGPIGVKTGAPDRLDIPDMFTMSPQDLQKIMFHDPVKFRPDFSKLSDEQVLVMARNRETLTLLVWEPYMHNPKLMHRLQRLDMPVLFLRGASDGLVCADYVARYAALVKDARIVTIPEAGHAPQAEQPAALAKAVLDFFAA